MWFVENMEMSITMKMQKEKMKNLDVTLYATMSSYMTWKGTVQVPADLTPEQEQDISDFLHDEMPGGFKEDDGRWEKEDGTIAPADPKRRPEYQLKRDGDVWVLLTLPTEED